jgi:thiol-disulfide isomerase/thioredoxin
MSALDVPLTLLDPEGGWINAPVHVHDLHGRPVLLHFWSTNCDPCEGQVLELQGWLKEFGPRGLRVIGVHVPMAEEELEKALDTNALEAEVKRLGLRYPVAVDDGSMAAAYGVEGLPACLVYDPNGVLRHRAAGEDALSPLLRQLLERLTGPEATSGAFAP